MPEKDYQEAVNRFVRVYNATYHNVVAPNSYASSLITDQFIADVRNEGYKEEYIDRFLMESPPPRVREFYKLTKLGVFFNKGKGSPLQAKDYEIDRNKFNDYILNELLEDPDVWDKAELPALISERATEKLDLFYSAGLSKFSDMNRTLVSCKTEYGGQNPEMIHIPRLRYLKLTSLKSGEEMDKLNSALEEVGDPSKKSRNERNTSCQNVMKQMNFAMASHKQRGFLSMLFHPVTYYREYKAIENAKSTLVSKFGISKEKVDNYASFIDAQTDSILKSQKNGSSQIEGTETALMGRGFDHTNRRDYISEALDIVSERFGDPMEEPIDEQTIENLEKDTDLMPMPIQEKEITNTNIDYIISDEYEL